MYRPKVLIFASGSAYGGGSGFEKLVIASRVGELDADIVGVISNHGYGGVRTRADRFGTPFELYPKPWDAKNYQRLAIESGADFFILSGWLKLVTGLDPTTRFNSKTVFNIHPGPLPEFGGLGLYGDRVHEAVIAAFKQRKITHSAVSMHFITEEYDNGPVFFRHKIKINEDDTIETLGQRLREKEHAYYPIIANLVVRGLIKWDGENSNSLEIPVGYEVERDG